MGVGDSCCGKLPRTKNVQAGDVIMLEGVVPYDLVGLYFQVVSVDDVEVTLGPPCHDVLCRHPYYPEAVFES